MSHIEYYVLCLVHSRLVHFSQLVAGIVQLTVVVHHLTKLDSSQSIRLVVVPILATMFCSKSHLLSFITFRVEGIKWHIDEQVFLICYATVAFHVQNIDVSSEVVHRADEILNRLCDTDVVSLVLISPARIQDECINLSDSLLNNSLLNNKRPTLSTRAKG